MRKIHFNKLKQFLFVLRMSKQKKIDKIAHIEKLREIIIYKTIFYSCLYNVFLCVQHAKKNK